MDTSNPDDTEKLAGSLGHFCHPEEASGELPPSWLPWEEPPAPPPTHTQSQTATWVFLQFFLNHGLKQKGCTLSH